MQENLCHWYLPFGMRHTVIAAFNHVWSSYFYPVVAKQISQCRVKSIRAGGVFQTTGKRKTSHLVFTAYSLDQLKAGPHHADHCTNIEEKTVIE